MCPDDVTETEQELVTKAQEALSSCNWTVGEAAARWTTRYANGKTDADFGKLVGLSGDMICQRRRVWEEFSDVYDTYHNLTKKWSIFYTVLSWPDRREYLEWANENKATVKELKAFRRMQDGEDLTTEPDAEPPVEELGDSPGTSSAVSTKGQSTPDPVEQSSSQDTRPTLGIADPNEDRTRLAPDPGSSEERNERRRHARSLIKAAASLQLLGVDINQIIQLARDGWANGRELGEVDMPDNTTLDAIMKSKGAA